ncbi:RDD family protein [Chitinophaga eiseniae]|uniref:RDD family protein n=1 Tax=Chitinophaga eiseniae TaxID=634771 RepID=A0A847SW50_9BACT|nr:RDD family protein [Chitinophaga eiseniae]NLR82349.1 RDD family protein [Chitinophaga eiseniae]
MEDILLLEPDVEKDYPLLSARVQSTFIDLLFIVLLMFIFGTLLEQVGEVPDGVRIGLFVFVWIVYEPLFTTLGATVGNYIKGIRVRQHNNTSRRLPFYRALFRYLVKCFLGWVSFLTIHTNKERRAIHDLLSGSVMIYREK